MAGAQKYAASADRHRENFQPVPGAEQFVDAGTQKIKPELNHGLNLNKWIDGWLDEGNASANPSIQESTNPFVNLL